MEKCFWQKLYGEPCLEMLGMKELSESLSAALILVSSRGVNIEINLTIEVQGPTKLFTLNFS
jgi:hypothetical protein